MFHTYILAYSGNVVDFDRASFLMDKDLLDQSIRAMKAERDFHPRSDATYGAQWVWDHYCGLHRQRHGCGFVPDVNPRWDRGDAQAEGSRQPPQQMP